MVTDNSGDGQGVTAIRDLPRGRLRRLAPPRALVPTLVFVGLVVAIVSSLGAPLIPAISHADGVPLADAQWSLTVTLLVGAIATPVMGRLGDGPARRPVILAGLLVVVLGSVLAALPLGFPALLVGRGLQGVGLGLTPLAIATARDALSAERARPAMALLSITTVAGVGLGYPITGLIAQIGGLHVAYWFGAVVSLLVLLAAIWVVPPSGHLRRIRLDIGGALLLGIGLTALLLVITEGGAWGWFSVISIVAATVSAAAIVGWVVHELRSAHPLVNLRILRDRSVLAADVAAALAGLGMYLLISLVVQLVQTPVNVAGGLGGSVVVAGLVLLPFSAGSVVASRIIPLLRRRNNGRLLIPTASVLALAGMVLFAFLRGNVWWIAAVMAAVGLAVGAVFAVMPGMITRAVPPRETGSAMSFNQVLRYVGYSTGSAISATILTSHTSPGQHYPSAVGYSVAAFTGIALWVVSILAGTLLPAWRGAVISQAGEATEDEQASADESIADAVPEPAEQAGAQLGG